MNMVRAVLSIGVFVIIDFDSFCKTQDDISEFSQGDVPKRPKAPAAEIK
jgi:hypothetical protein